MANPTALVAAAIDRSTTAALVLELRRWYASEEMHDAMASLQANYEETRQAGGLADYYRTLVTGQNQNLEKADELNTARRRVAHFFITWMKLCEHDLLSEDLAANLIAPEAIEFFLRVVDPLDQAHRRLRLGLDEESQTREFFERLRSEAVSPP